METLNRHGVVRLTDNDCHVVPGSVIDFHPRRDISGPQTELLDVLNSLCSFNSIRTTTRLEELLLVCAIARRINVRSYMYPGTGSCCSTEP